MVHAKTCVVDRDLAIVGTANIDPRSMRLNFEVVAAIYGGQAVAELAALFEGDRARARPKGWLEAGEPVGRRLFASAARLLAPQL
jgi:cardiolipin synthase